jgi:hypothetical protein
MPQNYSACRSTRVSAACQPGNQMQRCDKSQPYADALSAHHPMRNAGSTLSADKEHAIRYYACTDCSESAECYRLQKGGPRHLNLPGGSHLRDTGKAPHGLFESLKSEKAQNVRQKVLHQQNVRDSFTFVKPNLCCRWALTSFPCTSKIGSLLLPC